MGFTAAKLARLTEQCAGLESRERRAVIAALERADGADETDWRGRVFSVSDIKGGG